MTILTEDEIERYKGLSVLALESNSIPDIGEISIERLKLAECELTKRGYNEGLPYYVAFQQHIVGRGIHYLAEEIIGVRDVVLVRMLHFFNIPRLNRSEAMVRSKNKAKRCPITREKVVKAYGVIATREEFKDWRDLIGRVSKTTDLPEETVRLHLEELIGEKY